ncbi:hypothetical protein NUW58_g679 [Xylaria curta]|uniref:Uncharacterized protein n=1 Tax=Xylaria curta TaxID=42375 RepID=A0ACC1PNV3_9PEZI|nr:hypothetical protein NUW58_g679 [Xylaria curta]
MNEEGKRIVCQRFPTPRPFNLRFSLRMPSYGTIGDSKMGGSSDIKDPERSVSQEATSPDHTDSESVGNIQTYDYDESQKIGVTGATFLILNKMIGTGIFSTPSSIFAATGSVGVSLFLWVIGGILTFAGLSVWLEFGLAIPR